MTKRKPASQDHENAQTFEQALAALESIVDAMEQEQLPLEDLVSQYEKGSKLLENCESMLKSARDRIELITLQARKDTHPHEAISEPPSAATDAPDDDDDIRLF
jgi:exodeoxyribonuclease VII small subunit